jgi:hypothetical protein
LHPAELMSPARPEFSEDTSLLLVNARPASKALAPCRTEWKADSSISDGI